LLRLRINGERYRWGQRSGATSNMVRHN
jgi:hypothetical protein